jgi:hypothetical protein
MGTFIPCSDRDRLGELAAKVNASEADATILADKEMIIARLQDLGVSSGRDGTHELNRKLTRAVRHGW